MRFWILLTLAGMLCVTGAALAQDPGNAYIPDIQGGVFPDGTFVTMRDVVVTGKAPFGVFVQEPTAASFPFSGIWCYTSSTPAVEIGDLIDFSGVYTEYFDVSEIDLTQGGAIVLRGQATVPTPAVETVQDLTTGSANAEQWEGVLVQVQNVEVVNTGLGFGEYSIMPIGGSPFDTLRCDDKSINAPTMPPVGAQFNSITGNLDYTFSDFKLQPRDSDDFDWIAGEPAPALEIAYCTSNSELVVVFDRSVEQTSAEDPFNYFFNNLGEFAATATLTAPDAVTLTVSTPFTPGSIVPEILDVSAVQNQSGTPMGTESITFIAGVNTIDFVQTIGSGLDSSQVAGEVVTIDGIVTGDNTYDYIAPDGANRFYIEMAGGGQWSGLFVFDRAHAVQRGDEVRVAGRVQERFFKTEIGDPPFVDILSSGNPIPATELVGAATMAHSATAEPYEGVLVRMETVEVNQDTSFGFDEWTVVEPGMTDTVVVGNDGLYFYDPQVGDPLGFVQGPVDYSFGDPKIEPRRWDDIDSPGGIGVSEQGAPGVRTELLGGFPNPFNPATSIRFNLRASGPVEVSIYDQAGRLVRRLVAGEVFDAGSHELRWDGRDDRGASLASGVYFYRFHADGVQETRKLALVK